MTTAVTIDAHAGWPISVTLISGEPSYPKKVYEEVVPANTVRIFHIHSGLRIINIEELPLPKEE